VSPATGVTNGASSDNWVSMTEVKTRKKLIEVALPLEAINVASAREKSIRHGHPSTLHLWWARRPLAAARAVIFSQMVDDPSSYVDTLLGDPATKRAAERELKKRLVLWQARVKAFEAASGTEAVAIPEPGAKPTLEGAAADLERERLFRIIEELVMWENTTNEEVLERARAEIWQSWRRACLDNIDHPRAKELFDRHKLPAFHDPFAGGGALPLEAQRLGLEAYASDLNPVAVLINKAMIEIPPKFAGKPPVNPVSREEAKNGEVRAWKGAQGLAEDVRYYGQWMRDEAEKRIGHLYPKVEVTAAMASERPDLKSYVGRKLTVIASLWARTVKSPNPAFRDVDVPLVSSFMMSTKAGKEAYIEPVIERSSYSFTVKIGVPNNLDAAKAGTKAGRGSNFRCVMSGVPISGDYIKAEGKGGRMGARLMCVVADGDPGRLYLPPTEEQEYSAYQATPDWIPEGEIATRMTGGNCTPYGLTSWGDLFTQRQLVALNTFSELASEVCEKAQIDSEIANLAKDSIGLESDGTGAQAYAEAIAVYLSCAVNRTVNSVCSLVKWNSARSQSNVVFSRQALPMLWDYADVNPLAGAAGDISISADGVAKALASTDGIRAVGFSVQADAARQHISDDKIVSTDPPYYDNIGYADLSDFFYVWLRRSLQKVFPSLFSTLAVPKAEELVATAYRHGGRESAEIFFLDGMTQAMGQLAQSAHQAFPVTIYYAFKQAESETELGTASTGWETFLEAVMTAGLVIHGTWPIRTEREGRPVGNDTNSLASSILLVCRRRLTSALVVSRREFIAALKSELPSALRDLQRGNIAPVDLAQAAIGPGMAVYSRYAKVLDAEGVSLPVREALALINQTLDEVLSEQEGDFDADTRWAVAWFEQLGFAEGEFGTADVLARAKVTAVVGLVDAGIVEAGRGKVRLLKPAELKPEWDPATDARLTVWEIVHHLIRVLEAEGEGAAAVLMAKIGVRAETARELAYRLYTACERRKRATEAQSYNGLVQSWPEISRLARASAEAVPAAADADLFGPR
jgi:putative DNA methylase